MFICVAPLKSHHPQEYKQTNKSKCNLINCIYIAQNDNHIASLALQAIHWKPSSVVRPSIQVRREDEISGKITKEGSLSQFTKCIDRISDTSNSTNKQIKHVFTLTYWNIALYCQFILWYSFSLYLLPSFTCYIFIIAF